MKQPLRTHLKRQYRKLEFAVLSLAVTPRDRPALRAYLRASLPARVWIIYDTFCRKSIIDDPDARIWIIYGETS